LCITALTPGKRFYREYLLYAPALCKLQSKTNRIPLVEFNKLFKGFSRINESWQSGFDDTERRPYTTQRWSENWVEIHSDDAARRGIESGDQVMLYSIRVARNQDTIPGLKGDDFQFSSLLKNGHIVMEKAAVTAVAIVSPVVKKGMMYANMLDMRQSSNSLKLQSISLSSVSISFCFRFCNRS